MMEKKFKEWAKEEFNVDMKIDEIQSLLRGKNGEVYRKLFQTFMDTVVGEKTFEKIQEATNAKEAVKELEQLEELARKFKLSDDVYKIKPVNNRQIRETKAYLWVLNKTVDSLAKEAAESNSNSDGFTSSKLNQEIKELNESVENLIKFTSNSGKDGQFLSGGDNFNPVHYGSPDDLVTMIEEKVDRINDLLFELNEMSHIEQRKDRIEIDVDALRDLVDHECDRRVVNDESSLPLEVQELNPIAFKKYQEERKLQAPKLLEQLAKSMDMIKQTVDG